MEIRFVHEQEFKEAVRLADAVFRDSEHSSMGTAFPQIFSSGVRHSYGAFEDGKLVSFMGLVPNMINIGTAAVPIYCLGSVCTDPLYRGKGYASLILDEVFEFSRKAGAGLLLISGDRSLYTRRGCIPFGSVRHYKLAADDFVLKRKADTTPLQFRMLEETDWFQLYQLTKKVKAGYDQSLFDFAGLMENKALAAIYKMTHEVYVAEQDGRLIAAAIVAVQDQHQPQTEPFVVEWYGLAGAAVSLISYLMKTSNISTLHLISPWHEAELHKSLDGVPFTVSPNAGTIKIMNYTNLWLQLLPYLHDKNAKAAQAVDLVEGEGSESASLSISGDIVPLSHEEWVALLFNPDAALPSLGRYQSIIRSLFPIEFPYTAGLHFI